MSPSDNGPYKSRLFSFINRQAINLNSRLNKSFRQLKIVTEWGVQILLYPVYLLVQTGRWASRQLTEKMAEIQHYLPQSPEKKPLSPPEPQLDEPISHVLAEIIADSSLEIPPHSSALDRDLAAQSQETILFRAKVRGIASVLTTGNLVLITDNNQILNIISLQQQKRIEKRLILALANYYYQRRYLDQRSLNQLPLIKTNNPHVLFPIRLFWELMSWMQSGSIAISVDLFGESSLKRLRLKTNFDASSLSIFPETRGLFKNLDQTIADLESKYLDLNNQENNYLKNASNLDDSQQIQILIKAALKYFFNTDQPRINEDFGAEKAKAANSQKLSLSEDTWLSLEDLFGYKNEEHLQQFMTKETDSTPSSSEKSVSQQRQLKIKKSTELLANQPQVKSSKKSQKFISYPTSKKPQKSTITRPSASEKLPQEIERDWLETKATPIGYVKHPLEKILVILDQIILYLEEILINICNWLNKRSRK